MWVGGARRYVADTVKMLKHTLHTAVEEKQTMEQQIAMLSGRLEEEKVALHFCLYTCLETRLYTLLYKYVYMPVYAHICCRTCLHTCVRTCTYTCQHIWWLSIDGSLLRLVCWLPRPRPKRLSGLSALRPTFLWNMFTAHYTHAYTQCIHTMHIHNAYTQCIYTLHIHTAYTHNA